jgi:hypothetical protein
MEKKPLGRSVTQRTSFSVFFFLFVLLLAIGSCFFSGTLVTEPCSFPLAGAGGRGGGRAGGQAGGRADFEVNENVHRPIVSSNPVSYKNCVSQMQYTWSVLTQTLILD